MAGETNGHLRIVRFTSENVKRLKAVEITPEGNVVVIAGRNAQGKSSVLDAIWMALAGGSGAKETSRPIRDGEQKAHATLDLGDLIVTRKWTGSGTTLEVAARDGARYPSPQTVLDSLIGRLSFDPLEFAEQDAKKQLQTLLDVAELSFDPAAVDAERKRLYDDRTEANREVKRVEAALASTPAVPEETPDEELSAAAIATELREADEAARFRSQLGQRTEGLETEVAECAQEVEQAQARLENARARLKAARDAYDELPEAVEVEPIKARLDAVDATNAAVRTKQQRVALAEELATHQAASDELTEQIEAIDAAKAKAIAEAKMPLEELSFDEHGVLYNGVPFSQASAAERLRVGIAMAMALNPRIRVIRITDGSLLDSENLQLIEEMAGAHDFQVWIERVDETGKVGITIEDGEIAAVNGKAVERAPEAVR